MSAVGFEAQIAEALLARLAALTLSPALLVAYPDVPFPATGSDKPDTYLRASLMRSGAQTLGINEWAECPGILQVDVVYSAQSGQITPLNIAGSVATWFARNTRMINGSMQVDVYDEPAIGRVMEDDGAYNFVPVSIRYRSFKR